MRFPSAHACRRVATWALPALLGFGVAGLDIGAAAPLDLTSNFDNSVSTVVVAPPENVEATSSLDLLFLSCRVTVTWTAPAMDGIGGYEVRRVLAAGGTELDPPTFTTDLFFVDDQTPLTLLGNAFEYEVRSTLAGTTWRSEWVTADTGVSLLCLDLLNAAPDLEQSDPLLPDALPEPESPTTTAPESGDASVPGDDVDPADTDADPIPTSSSPEVEAPVEPSPDESDEPDDVDNSTTTSTAPTVTVQDTRTPDGESQDDGTPNADRPTTPRPPPAPAPSTSAPATIPAAPPPSTNPG